MKRKTKLLVLLISSIGHWCFSQAKVEISSIDDAITYALHNNENLLVSRQLAACTVRKSKSEFGTYIPQLNLSFTDSAMVSFNANDYRSKSLSIGCSWIAFDGGERKLQYGLNCLEASFSQLQTEEAVESHCLRIRQTYYEYQKELRNEQVLLKTMENADCWKNALEKERALGMILETEYLEYELKLLELQEKLVKGKDRQNQILFLLKTLLGLRVDDEVIISLDEDFTGHDEALKVYSEEIYQKAKSKSIDHKKMMMEIEHEAMLRNLEKAWYVPKISLQPGLIFQGEDFPMHGPKYQLMVSMAFDRNPFVTFQSSQTIGIEKNSLTEATSFGQSSSKNDFGWRIKNRMWNLNFQSQVLSLSSLEENLKTNLNALIMEHNQLCSTITILKKDIAINEKILDVMALEIERGMKCPMDYIEQQIKLSEKMNLLYETYVQVSLIEFNLESITGLKIGEFTNESKK